MSVADTNGVSIGTASATVTGFLSAADWIRFDAGGGGGGASGSFTSQEGYTITVVGGIITNINTGATGGFSNGFSNGFNI